MSNQSESLNVLYLQKRVVELLNKSGVDSLEKLRAQFNENPDAILDIAGIGPKTYQDIILALQSYSSEPASEPPPEPVSAYSSDPDSEYQPPVRSLADQFKYPDQKIKKRKDKKRGELAQKEVAYNPPVPSLADQFRVEIPPQQKMVYAVDEDNYEEKTESQKEIKVKKKDKGKRKEKKDKDKYKKKKKVSKKKKEKKTKDKKKEKKSKKQKKSEKMKSGKKKKKSNK